MTVQLPGALTLKDQLLGPLGTTPDPDSWSDLEPLGVTGWEGSGTGVREFPQPTADSSSAPQTIILRRRSIGAILSNRASEARRLGPGVQLGSGVGLEIHLAQSLGRQVGVDLGRADVGVTEHFL